jgi:hypothetical protein
VSDSGTAATANGITGAVLPTFSTTVNAITIDGSQQWICRGSATQNWGGAASLVAPTVAQATRPAVYPQWAANTFYSPSLAHRRQQQQYAATDHARNARRRRAAWNVAYNGTTADNTAVWTNKGSKNWASGHVYAIGDLVSITFTYFVTTYTRPNKYNDGGDGITRAVTVTDIFQVTTGGTSGGAPPPGRMA